MKLTMANMKRVVNTPAVKSLVSSWLLAETMYKAVNGAECEVYAELLREIPLWADCKHGDGKRITEVGQMYLSTDEESCQEIYKRATAEFIDQKALPAGSEIGTSPSYTYWELRKKTELAIVKLTGEPFGVTSEKLYCSADGVANHNNWINSIVGAIITLPDFVAPEFPKASK